MLSRTRLFRGPALLLFASLLAACTDERQPIVFAAPAQAEEEERGDAPRDASDTLPSENESAEKATADAPREAAAPPPLVIDTDAPLLLDEPDEGAVAPADEKGEPEGEVADNEPCFVCHDNYRTEPMATSHAKENVGCVDCHGDSFAHRNDENNTTPPDVMFPAEFIGPSCKECHESHDAPARKVVVRYLERCPPTKDPKALVCTDCHGEHRLVLRSVVWNRRTGDLIGTGN